MKTYFFRSRKDPLFGIIILGAAIVLLSILANGLFTPESLGTGDTITFILLALSAGLLFWIWLGTYYYIKKGVLYLRFGPFRGKIPVNAIHTLICSTTLWTGFRPALARNGIILKFNQYDEVYISPQSNASFVETLSNLNPGVKVIQKSTGVHQPG